MTTSDAKCPHIEALSPVEPDTKDTCLACVEMGDTWFSLRVCLECGNVGCCNDSKNQHATAHHKQTGHAVIQSYEPEETWRYCYVHDCMLPNADAPLRQ